MQTEYKQQEPFNTPETRHELYRVLPAGVCLRVLVACEYSGTVREAFKALGHYAMSCDLLDTEIPGEHYKGDVRDILCDGWDIMIAHPPCTHLAVSGARWFKDKQREQAEALEFVGLLMNAPIPRIAIENPISIISSRIRKPEQIIQPWQFGHGETKSTCLWLKNLPKLEPTKYFPPRIVNGKEKWSYLCGWIIPHTLVLSVVFLFSFIQNLIII